MSPRVARVSPVAARLRVRSWRAAGIGHVERGEVLRDLAEVVVRQLLDE